MEILKNRCESCPARSADCAYGDLRGGQSCWDTLQRFSEAVKQNGNKMDR
jgi:hypothetical protein